MVGRTSGSVEPADLRVCGGPGVVGTLGFEAAHPDPLRQVKEMPKEILSAIIIRSSNPCAIIFSEKYWDGRVYPPITRVGPRGL
jgi:hypothetical protein